MRGVNVIAMKKDEEKYVFLYDDNNIDKLLRTLARYAADDELSFSWYDAAVLSRRVAAVQRDRRASSSESA